VPTLALTVVATDRVKPPKQGQVDYFDHGFPGLALRVSFGGSKTWVYVYRLHNKLRRLTLGRYPAMSLADARDAWREARKAVGKGESPTPRRPVYADSFAAVADEWLKRDQAQNRSVAEVRRVLERDVKPAWDGRLISTLGRRDVIELIDGIVDRGAVTYARRVHAHLHRLFRWSVGRGILPLNPMADLPKPGGVAKRDRALTDGELGLVLRAAGDGVAVRPDLPAARPDRCKARGNRCVALDGDRRRGNPARRRADQERRAAYDPAGAAGGSADCAPAAHPW
jgi:Arm DNA-binding domain